ncbi:MAG: hypothetical protein ACE15C_07530 [Phycisphaerae bacterium]
MFTKCGIQRAKSRRGSAYILAMVLLAMFTAMAVAFSSAADMNVHKSDNSRILAEARLAAESGMSFITWQLEHCGVSGALRGRALLNSLADKLGTVLNGTPNLQGATVSYNGSTIAIPSIAVAGGKSFTTSIALAARDTLRVTVTGHYASGTGASATQNQKQVIMDFRAQWDPALGYGMASKGPVQMGMNNTFVGMTQPSDGSIYSGAPGVAVSCGSGHISGDVAISDPGASVSLSGVQVDGTVFYNAPPVTMPTIDRSVYKALATNTMDFASPPGGIYQNIRIPPNTNPTFNSAVTIQGVMYVQAPNKIYFNNNCTFTGVMIADDPPAGSPDTDNFISYKNNMTFSNVDALPDIPAFAGVKKLRGAEILAPGFTFEFKNNLCSVGGLMAVKALTVKNNETATVYGSLLIYGDLGVDFKNNDSLTISLSYSTPPPGFKGYGIPPLLPDPATYVEK